MKVTIDEDLCRGHGVCCSLCPEVFALTDDGYAEVLVPEVPTDLEDAARSAVTRCPERAISFLPPKPRAGSGFRGQERPS